MDSYPLTQIAIHLHWLTFDLMVRIDMIAIAEWVLAEMEAESEPLVFTSQGYVTRSYRR